MLNNNLDQKFQLQSYIFSSYYSWSYSVCYLLELWLVKVLNLLFSWDSVSGSDQPYTMSYLRSSLTIYASRTSGWNPGTTIPGGPCGHQWHLCLVRRPTGPLKEAALRHPLWSVLPLHSSQLGHVLYAYWVTGRKIYPWRRLAVFPFLTTMPFPTKRDTVHERSTNHWVIVVLIKLDALA